MDTDAMRMAGLPAASSRRSLLESPIFYRCFFTGFEWRMTAFTIAPFLVFIAARHGAKILHPLCGVFSMFYTQRGSGIAGIGTLQIGRLPVD